MSGMERGQHGDRTIRILFKIKMRQMSHIFETAELHALQIEAIIRVARPKK